ncbi:hypothetical protein HOD20_07640 [archaeon]|jgi:hypothetical protein|nr:hypothetical protein [archaeon]MBT4352380.1 hypothetical protein [archaeon]MBT4646631.1 hypothetical protein [archaeon]MBT6821919.1 hypothetical protein [archaeon]
MSNTKKKMKFSWKFLIMISAGYIIPLLIFIYLYLYFKYNPILEFIFGALPFFYFIMFTSYLFGKKDKK